jgi:hypothetical protein
MLRSAMFAAMIVAAPGLAFGQFADATKGAPGQPVEVPEGAKQVKLEGRIDDVEVGGGGKYLLLVMRGVRQVAVYDIEADKIARTFALPTDEVLVTAGSDKAVFIYPDQQMIERYNLTTGVKEKKAQLPVRGVIKAATMGSGSKGPLLIHAAAGGQSHDAAAFFFVDILKMKIIPIDPAAKAHNGSLFRDVVHVRASASGQVFGVWTTSPAYRGLETFVLDKTVRVFYASGTAGHLVPSADGRAIYTATGGAYSADLKPIQRGMQAAKGSGPSDTMLLPSTDPTYFVGVRGLQATGPRSNATRMTIRRSPIRNAPTRVTVTVPEPTKPPTTEAVLEVYRRGGNEPIATVEGLDEMVGDYRDQSIKDGFTVDKRIHFHAESGTLVTVPPSNDCLIVRKVVLPPAK